MIIQLSDIVFSYTEPDSAPTLCLPEWSLMENEHVFIHGPSGCGKSTLLNIISGILKPQRGNVNVLGQSLERLSSRQRDRFRANNLGYVFQQFNLIPYLSAIENIRLANYFSINKVSEEQLLTDIHDLLSALNVDATDRQKPASQLSIGQQQRIAIARALINKPSVLIVDEPTSSLDQKNRDDFMSLLMHQLKDHSITLVFVSHDISLADYFTRVDSLSDMNHRVVQ